MNHYIAQLVLDNSTRSRADTVAIAPKLREAVRTCARELRNCIDQSTIKRKKRDALHLRMDTLESELEKRRTNMLTVARIVFDLRAIPESMWTSYEVANKLIAKVMQAIAEAKDQEEKNHPHPAPRSMNALSPPRPITVAAP